MDDDELDNDFPPNPEADEQCPLLALLPNMEHLGQQWPCPVCGLTPDDPSPLDLCLSETVQLAVMQAVHLESGPI